MVRSLTLAVILGVVVALAGCKSTAAPGPKASIADQDRDAEEIRSVLKNIERTFNSGELDTFMTNFADDAVILSQGSPDLVGKEAIRAVYATAMASATMKLQFSTAEIHALGDLAYERGTYALQVSDKASGKLMSLVESRHIHIFRRGATGTWQTWRMMVNSAKPAETR